MDVRIPANNGVIRYLERMKSERPPLSDVRPPADPRHDYWGIGAHPEIVERLWDQLGSRLAREARQVVLEAPALIHSATGVILAVALGTSYAIRVPSSAHAVAMEAGAKTQIHWSDGTVLDLQAEFGDDWFAGSWSSHEGVWCTAQARELDTSPKAGGTS